MLKDWILIALAAAVAAEGAFLVSDRLRSTAWTYTIIAPADADLRKELDEAGRNGWEIVAARRAVTNDIPAYELILKRPASAGDKSQVLPPFLPKASIDPK